MPHVILPYLHQGSAPPPGPTLARNGYRAVVLCAREYQPPAERFPGVLVFHAPNHDAARYPTLDELQRATDAAAWVVERVRAKEPVLVTCRAGRNRSGLVSALAAAVLTGWSGADCVRLVRRARPLALTNQHFARLLETIPTRSNAACRPKPGRVLVNGMRIGFPTASDIQRAIAQQSR